MKTPAGMVLVLWAMVGALAGAVAWGVGPAQADDAASDAYQPYIAPIVPTYDKSQSQGRIGVGEVVRDHGASLRKDLIRKRTIGDILDRSNPGHGSSGGQVGDAGKPPETVDPPYETQPISLAYGPADAPEPDGLALIGIGLASWILLGKRTKR